MSITNERVKWAAKLANVREVSLLGTANLDFWKRWLQSEELEPLVNRGRAQILVIAANARYMGKSFRELSWEGSIYLPSHGRARQKQRKLFFAKIRGITTTFDFLPSQDSLTISRSGDSNIFQALLQSDFAARKWMIREHATHAKSKTYTRETALSMQ